MIKIICKLSELLIINTIELYKVVDEDVYEYKNYLLAVTDQNYKIFTNLEEAIKEINYLLEIFDSDIIEEYLENNYLNTTKLYYENKDNFIMDIPENKINIYKNNYLIIVNI